MLKVLSRSTGRSGAPDHRTGSPPAVACNVYGRESRAEKKQIAALEFLKQSMVKVICSHFRKSKVGAMSLPTVRERVIISCGRMDKDKFMDYIEVLCTVAPKYCSKECGLADSMLRIENVRTDSKIYVKISKCIEDELTRMSMRKNIETEEKKGKTASKSKKPSSQAAAKAKEAKKKESAAAKKPDLAPSKPDSRPSSNEPTPHSSPNIQVTLRRHRHQQTPEEEEELEEEEDEEEEEELKKFTKCENKDKLLPIYNKYLENHSLRPILLKNLASFFEALPENDRDKAAQSFPDFMPVDDSKPVYRAKAKLAEQLAQIVHLFEPVKVNKFFSRLALILSSDRVYDVRIMGVKLLAKVIGVLIQEEWTDYSNKQLTHPDVEFLPLSNEIILQIRRTFWTIGNWQQRQSFGRLLATLLQKELIDHEQFCVLFGEDVMRISEDEVPNVRQCFCALGQITSSSDFFRATHEGISAAIRDKLQEFVVHDSDAEIRYQAQIALEQAKLQNEVKKEMEKADEFIKNLLLS